VNGRFKEGGGTHILMLDVFQKLQLTVGPLRQHRRTKRLHDLLHCDRHACKLVLCGTVGPILRVADKWEEAITNQTRPNAPRENARMRTEDGEARAPRTHPNGLEVDISSGDLRKRVRETEILWRSVREARLERGPEDGEFDERHILQSPEGSDELGGGEEAQRTERQGESDIPKRQADDDYVSRGTGLGVIYGMISSNVISSLELEHLFASCQRPSKRHPARNPPGFHRTQCP
jgi:hypothetical protein